ncbi:MAG: UvrD-helicase domain-containing protein [Thermodesulfobacteriota bacterium]
MTFFADLHVHSKFSRATAKHLDLENLYRFAKLKGLSVVGTGDFTHPAWFSEISEKLEPAETGLLKLRKPIALECDKTIPSSCNGDVYFILESEVSNIYKKSGKVRKNHNLLFFPDLDTASRLNKALDRIGNINSDGRPILGLDARHLLETVLDISDRAFIIPAHIWTPWFSLLGSKSGFDSLKECFDDLTPHIFALETGLSSDPEMNWRVSALDAITLVSNSDAHSPEKLGREANIFNTEPAFDAIRNALSKKDRKGFSGTVEFYPEEGKYHLDGHRKCNIRFRPEESIQHRLICPKCDKPLTLGVLHRIEELSDRKTGEKPENTPLFSRILPLTDILAQVLGTGSGSKKVMERHHQVIDRIGPELDVLLDAPESLLNSIGIPLLGEAIRRMRQNEISISPGYDGEFGTIKIFSTKEKKEFLGQSSLFIREPSARSEDPRNTDASSLLIRKKSLEPMRDSINCRQVSALTLTDQQCTAITHESQFMMIVAGPGTGKTHTITHRILHLILEKKVSPESILAVTFTHKAAEEMRGRISALLPGWKSLPCIATFHSFCLAVLKEEATLSRARPLSRILDDIDQKALTATAMQRIMKKGYVIRGTPETVSLWIGGMKQHSLSPSDDLSSILPESEIDSFRMIFSDYEKLLSIQNYMDYEDLILRTIDLFSSNPRRLTEYQNRYPYVFVDEYQDINSGQYRLIRLLYPGDRNNGQICVIGDPHQSIYGFRGSDVRYFNHFVIDYPNAHVCRLDENFRSTRAILDASHQIIGKNQDHPFLSVRSCRYHGAQSITVLENATEKEESVSIAQMIEELTGGTGYFSIDSGRIDGSASEPLTGFSDIAVLFRTGRQAPAIARALETAGIPYQMVIKHHMNPTLLGFISFFKLIEKMGSFMDLERALNFTGDGIGKNGLAAFQEECFKREMDVGTGLDHLIRFPADGLNRKDQIRLVSFIKKCHRLHEEIRPLGTTEKILSLFEIWSAEKKLPEKESLENNLKSMILPNTGIAESVEDFFSTISLQQDPDLHNPLSEKVSLMTMHAAKGLEFKVVFIAGCENGLIPYRGSSRQRIDLEEERRLFYVAVTRAKELLILSWAKNRLIYGKREIQEISPYIRDIAPELKALRLKERKKEKKEEHTQLHLF